MSVGSPAKKAERLKVPEEARRLSYASLTLSGVQLYRTKEMPVAPVSKTKFI